MFRKFIVMALFGISLSAGAYETVEVSNEAQVVCTDLSQVAFSEALEQIYPPKNKHPLRAVDDPRLLKANASRPPIPIKLIKAATRLGAMAFGAQGYDKKNGLGYGLFSAHGAAIETYNECLSGVLNQYQD